MKTRPNTCGFDHPALGMTAHVLTCWWPGTESLAMTLIRLW
jgi:hypothetical protein